MEDECIVLRGIPYAQPPVGALRWATPRRESAWSGTRDARRFGPAPPQRPGFLMRILGGEALERAEDCLTLNVWTPGLDDARRPVLVWLHGGGFTSGAGSMPVYDGSALSARGDLVVVTVNYRLGALGFLALPELASSDAGANFGLLDQIAALEWVREHAESFGGDPDSVTVFGESAGAMCIGALLGAPRARGLFRRAALQSGACHNVSSPDQGLLVADQFRDGLARSGADRIPLRELSVEQILDAQGHAVDAGWRSIVGLAFQPILDGAVISRAPLDAVAAGEARDVSLLVGTNRDEWSLYTLTDARLRQLDEDGLARRVARNLPPHDGDPDVLARRLAAAYREARAARRPEQPPGSPAELWTAFQTDRAFRMPAIRLAERQAACQPGTYAYLFTWPSPAFDGTLGACHGIEVPFVFGTTGLESVVPLVGSGPEAVRLSERIQDAWIAFARTGDPGWPAYDADARATMVWGRESGVEHAPLDAERAAWDRYA